MLWHPKNLGSFGTTGNSTFDMGINILMIDSDESEADGSDRDQWAPEQEKNNKRGVVICRYQIGLQIHVKTTYGDFSK